MRRLKATFALLQLLLLVLTCPLLAEDEASAVLVKQIGVNDILFAPSSFGFSLLCHLRPLSKFVRSNLFSPLTNNVVPYFSICLLRETIYVCSLLLSRIFRNFVKNIAGGKKG